MIRPRLIDAAAILALLVLPMPASGQNRSDIDAAEAVVRQALEAHAAMQWHAVAGLVHPEALRRFHFAQLERQRMLERLRSQAAEERHDSAMPAEVRAWFDEQRERHEAQHPSGVAADFANVSSLAELEALSPEEAFARWVEAHDIRWTLRRHHEAQGRDIPPEIPLARLHPASRVVGAVAEDDFTVQVLYRTTLPGAPAEDHERGRIAVATVRRSGEGWRIWTTERDPQLFGPENWGIAIELPEEREERLREAAGRSFAWPEGAAPRVRARVTGYPGDGRAPEAVWLEVLQSDGATARIELPYGALMPLWEYLQPWMYLSYPDGGARPSGG